MELVYVYDAFSSEIKIYGVKFTNVIILTIRRNYGISKHLYKRGLGRNH
jgi:hypothetical protein